MSDDTLMECPKGHVHKKKHCRTSGRETRCPLCNEPMAKHDSDDEMTVKVKV